MHRGPAKREIKQERAARTRVEILEAAIILFARRGFLATTMAELAKAIRMTPGALYWHFPTKEDLLLASIEELHQRYLREFTDLLGPAGQAQPARAQLIGFFSRSHAFIRYHREYGIFYGLVAAESAESNERVASALREAISVYVGELAKMVRRGQEAGEFRADLDATTIAHTLWGVYTGLLIHQNLFRDVLPYDPLVAALDQLVAGGMNAQQAEAQAGARPSRGDRAPPAAPLGAPSPDGAAAPGTNSPEEAPR